MDGWHHYCHYAPVENYKVLKKKKRESRKMAAVENYMVQYVCASNGFLLLPFAPAFILANPFNTALFGLAWGTVLLIFLILIASPCATELNCARVPRPAQTVTVTLASVASSGLHHEKVTYTKSSGLLATGIVRGSLITVTGASSPDFNGSFYVTAITDTTVTVKHKAAGTTSTCSITQIINYDSMRDSEKAVSKAVLIYYLLFLFLAVWGRMFLCSSGSGQRGLLGSVGNALNRTYALPSASRPVVAPPAPPPPRPTARRGLVPGVVNSATQFLQGVLG